MNYTGVGSLSLLQVLPNPEIEPRSPTLQVDSLPTEPQGKPSYTGMGSLSLLQGVFPTQELNQGLLHYSWILYQLSYQGSPIYTYIHVYIYICVCVCVSAYFEKILELSLLQGIFPTQESNRGLLHCRQFLYQLSYQGSPIYIHTYISAYFEKIMELESFSPFLIC